MEIISIETIEDFHKLKNNFFCDYENDFIEHNIDEMHGKRKQYIFRGISCLEQLYPAVIRKFEKKFASYDPNPKAVEKYELELLHNFEVHGTYTLNGVVNAVDFLATVDHYALPTRLLDWTRNPYIAVLFAVFDEYKKGVVSPKINNNKNKLPKRVENFDFNKYYYVLRINIFEHICFKDIPGYIKNISDNGYFMHDMPYTVKYVHILETVKRLFSKNLSELELKELIKYIFLNTNNEYLFNVLNSINSETVKMDSHIDKLYNYITNKEHTLLFVEPRNSNRRLVAQHGLFQFPFELNKFKIVNDILENADVFQIKKCLRKEIINELKAEGYDYYSLMPDLSGMTIYSEFDTDNNFKTDNKYFFRR